MSLLPPVGYSQRQGAGEVMHGLDWNPGCLEQYPRHHPTVVSDSLDCHVLGVAYPLLRYTCLSTFKNKLIKVNGIFFFACLGT